MSGQSVDADTLRAVEQFLYREARILDERRFNQWMELLAADLVYRMPTRANPEGKSRGERWSVEDELSSDDELGFFEDTKQTIMGRVMRFGVGRAWAEHPPSRTRRLVTNIEVESLPSEGELRVFSNFQLYRTRRETETHLYVGQRQDRLRRRAESFEIVERRVVLDTAVLSAPNLSLFF